MTQEQINLLVEASEVNYKALGAQFKAQGFSEALWEQVRYTLRHTGLSVKQYRRLWRDYHPKGKK